MTTDYTFSTHLQMQYHDDKERFRGTNSYYEWSFNACPLDLGNPAWYYKDTRTSYKATS